jgi:hypothetical protein
MKNKKGKKEKPKKPIVNQSPPGDQPPSEPPKGGN